MFETKYASGRWVHFYSREKGAVAAALFTGLLLTAAPQAALAAQQEPGDVSPGADIAVAEQNAAESAGQGDVNQGEADAAAAEPAKDATVGQAAAAGEGAAAGQAAAASDSATEGNASEGQQADSGADERNADVGTIPAVAEEGQKSAVAAAKQETKAPAISPSAAAPAADPSTHDSAIKLESQDADAQLAQDAVSVVTVSTYDDLFRAIGAIGNGTGSVRLAADLQATYEIGIDGTVTIYGEGHSITRTGQGSLFGIGSGATLNLGAKDYAGKLDLVGSGVNNSALLVVAGNPASALHGTLNMHDGVTIRDNTNYWEAGGVVISTGGVFNMHGGAIDNCFGSFGGGVYVDGRSMDYAEGVPMSTFNMYGGAIRNCGTNQNTYGGGVCVFNGGVFNMKDGELSGNLAFYGGAICIMSGTVNIEGGTIAGNHACSPYPDQQWAEEEAFGGVGGAICASLNEDAYDKPKASTLTISGGTIRDNDATFHGGGIYVDWGTVLSGTGGTVEHNQAKYGGGVNIGSGVRANLAGTSIANNYATGLGSDVFVASDSTVTLGDAKAMGKTYEARGIGDDSKAGRAIDGWYLDADSRYVPVREPGDALVDASGPLSGTALVASYREHIPVTVTVIGKTHEVAYDGHEHSVGVAYLYAIDDEESDALPDGLVVASKAADRATGTDAGRYSTGLAADSFALSGEGADAYDATFVVRDQATLVIRPRKAVFTSGSASKEYDGDPLTNGEVLIDGDGFVEGEGVVHIVTGSQTEVGSSPNTFSYTFKEGTKEGNYDIERRFGVLTVTEPNQPQPDQPETPDNPNNNNGRHAKPNGATSHVASYDAYAGKHAAVEGQAESSIPKTADPVDPSGAVAVSLGAFGALMLAMGFGRKKGKHQA